MDNEHQKKLMWTFVLGWLFIARKIVWRENAFSRNSHIMYGHSLRNNNNNTMKMTAALWKFFYYKLFTTTLTYSLSIFSQVLKLIFLFFELDNVAKYDWTCSPVIHSFSCESATRLRFATWQRYEIDKDMISKAGTRELRLIADENKIDARAQRVEHCLRAHLFWVKE